MIRAVIGAQYGDEGKGLMVDALARVDTLVVRYNGGAQAGHTVVVPGGRLHEFHHFGAGTFRGASTLLSRFFLVNPVLFKDEWETLADVVDVRPRRVFVDRLPHVSTPWDMMLNVALEQKRGDQRHGSCGVGINETVTRGESGCVLLAGELLGCDRSTLKGKLEAICNYACVRADRLGVMLPAEAFSHRLMERFIDDCEAFVTRTDSIDGAWLLSRTFDVLFEGAQGLRLDEQASDFPHVTRSRTGMPNILTLLSEARRPTEPIEAFYVTRCYTTRHGAGPLKGELPEHPFGWTGYETNDANEHQGTLRYALLDTDALAAVINHDMANARRRINAKLVVTCLDQFMKADIGLPEHIASSVGVPLAFASYGPTRLDVVDKRQVRA